MNDVHKVSRSPTEYWLISVPATQVNKENFSITTMIHESHYSHFDSLPKKNLHVAAHLPNAPCVLLVRLVQTWFCGTGLETLRNVEDTEHMQSSENNFHAAGLSRSSCTVGSHGSPLHLTSCHGECREMGWSQVPLSSSWLCLQPCFRILLRKTISTAGTQTLPTTPNISVCLTHTHTYFLFSCWQETPYLEGYALLWYICFWSTEWLLESGILNFQEEECYSHSKLWSLFPEHINCLLSFSLSWPL